jgi:hypothetical protein
MAIDRLLHKSLFQHEDIKAMAQAFEDVWVAVEMYERNDDFAQALAAKVVACARSGERNPKRLCEMVLAKLQEQADKDNSQKYLS